MGVVDWVLCSFALHTTGEVDKDLVYVHLTCLGLITLAFWKIGER